MNRPLLVTFLVAVAANAVAAEPPEDAPTDYWKDVPFERSNFDEVRQQVKKRYIDPAFDETWAFAQAASFAVGCNDGRPLLLFPEVFYLARKDDPREEGLLAGKALKLLEGDTFVILEKVAPAAKAPSKKLRLTDDEIKAARDWQFERALALRAAWTEVGFGASQFDRVMDFAQREFAATAGWTAKTAWVEASQGYAAALDPHCSLVPKRAWDDATTSTQNPTFDGIGAVLTQRPYSDYTFVEHPIEGQPAAKAGVRAGDCIIKVGDQDIRKESLSRVVSRIRGPKGTPVVLTVLREGEPTPKKLTVVRSHEAVANVEGKLLPGQTDLGYVKVRGFVKTTDDALTAEVERLGKLTRSGLRGLVLDLRNNAGGLLNQGIKLADLFLKEGTIVTVKNRNSQDDEVYSASPGDDWGFPVVVLVNAGTASAAEIVATALQANRRALILGERTFGKASVQTLFSPLLQDDYYIKLTVARYLDPRGPLSRGVMPDLTVPPAKEGKPSVAFREENLSGLPASAGTDYVMVNEELAARARACADKKSRGRKGADWQLIYGAETLECVITDRTAD